MIQLPGQPAAPEPEGPSDGELLMAAADMHAEGAFEAAAQRQRSAVRPEGGRKEGVGMQVLNLAGATAVRSFMAGPEAMQKVFEGEMDPTSKEGVAAAAAIARGQVGRGSPFAVRGSLGSAGGKMTQPSGMDILRNKAFEAGQPGVKAALPGPKSFLDRTWDNYTSRMAEHEVMQSDAAWSGGSKTFVQVVNDWYKRKGIDKTITKEDADRFMGSEIGKVLLRNLLGKGDKA